MKELISSFTDAAESKREEIQILQARMHELSRVPRESRDESGLATLRYLEVDFSKFDETFRKYIAQKYDQREGGCFCVL